MESEKDTKWSWVVAFSCCFINFLLYGVARLSGMMMVAVLDAFHTNRANASLPFSISTSVRNLSGFFVGYVGERLGLRSTIAVGCGLASIGASLCFFASDMQWMVVCWGGIFGIGFGLSTCLLPLAITQNFNRYRGIASGISYSGSYVGSFVFPPLLVTLLNEYGIGGTLLLIGGTFLNGCAVAFLFPSSELCCSSEKKIWPKSIFSAFKKRNFQTNSISFLTPISVQMCDDVEFNSKSCCELISYEKSSVETFDVTSNDSKKWHYFPKRMTRINLRTSIRKKQFFFFPLDAVQLISFTKHSYIKDDTFNNYSDNHLGEECDQRSKNELYSSNQETTDQAPTDIEKASSSKMCTLLKDAYKCLFGWSRLYGDPMFVVIAITMSLHTFVVVSMITIIEDFAKDIGIPDGQVHYVLMVLSIADLIGSLTLGFIMDGGLLSSCNFIILCFFGLFISQICISHARRFETLLSLVAMYGIFESGIIITFPLLIAHYIPKKKQAVAVASSNILSSPTVLLVPLLIGYFRDMKGCYSGAFYSLGMTSLSCCCAWLLASCSLAK